MKGTVHYFLALMMGAVTAAYGMGMGVGGGISTAEEIHIGRQIDAAIIRQLPVSRDPRLLARLDPVARRITAASDRRDLPYQFRIIASPELNAFTTMGGFVYVFSGLMEQADDDELAAVLAHEIGHVAARHAAKRLQAEMGYQFVMSLVARQLDQKEWLRVIDFGMNIVQSGFSRQDELDADRLGLQYAIRAGFDPYAAVRMLYKLQALERQRPQLTVGFLRSHPPHQQRIEYLLNELALYELQRLPALRR